MENKAVNVREKNEDTKERRIKISREKLQEIKDSYATKPIPNLGEKTDMKGGKVKTLFQSLSSNALPNTRKSRAPSQSFYE